MSHAFTERTVGELTRERIDRARIFQRHGIDYCCGGNRPLAEACQQAGISVEQICQELERADTQASTSEETDWSQASLTDLADHIEQRHHRYLRDEFPRLAELIDRAVSAHGQAHPELADVRQVFAGLRAELETHLMKEEQVLFPIIRQMERAHAAAEELPTFHCGSVRNPIAVMEHEHDEAGAALRTLRERTGTFEVPVDACETYRAMLAGLEQLEGDLHLHIHKENNILFPRAAQLEASFAAGA